jgi:hypothetical protein
MIACLRASAFALALAALSAVSAFAQQSRVAVGLLECRTGKSVGFIVGSVRQYECLFTPTSGPLQRYIGRVTRIGVDLGFTEQAGLVWSVFAPTSVIGVGALQGGYVGISAGAAVGVGMGANALVGGLDNSFALQPLSVEGQRGLNVAAGVATFELRFTP